MQIVIELPGPVRGKGAGRAFVVRGPGQSGGLRAAIFTDSKTRSYEAQLKMLARDAMNGQPPTEESVIVTIEARFAVPKSWSKRDRAAALAGHIWPTTKPDTNNISKTLDGLNEIVWRDDSQIGEERVIKRYSEHPGLTIIVETRDQQRSVAAAPQVLPLFGG
ncbi:MAG TPA: RusA family crossover junction endodeoxyribonuclease [Bradyrhizobium sp.]|nr:RusA family crossover junction endodeoxyribonuclease [Bradyrhizobium sp.]